VSVQPEKTFTIRRRATHSLRLCVRGQGAIRAIGVRLIGNRHLVSFDEVCRLGHRRSRAGPIHPDFRQAHRRAIAWAGPIVMNRERNCESHTRVGRRTFIKKKVALAFVVLDECYAELLSDLLFRDRMTVPRAR